MLFDRLAALLEYPESSPVGLCAAALDEGARQCTPAAVQLAAFAGVSAQTPLPDLQELYARTFDFDADTSLYVGHHLFGEEGRRGLLIAGLVDRYRRLGLDIGLELADHFSPVLRSLARDGDSEEAEELVRLALRPAIAKVLPGVERRADAYAAVLRALALLIDERTGEPFDSGSDRCPSFSSPSFLTSRS